MRASEGEPPLLPPLRNGSGRVPLLAPDVRLDGITYCYVTLLLRNVTLRREHLLRRGPKRCPKRSYGLTPGKLPRVPSRVPSGEGSEEVVA